MTSLICRTEPNKKKSNEETKNREGGWADLAQGHST